MKRPVLVRRDRVLPGSQAFAFVAGLVVALLFGAILLIASGHDPIEVYGRMWSSSFGSTNGLGRTFNRAVPLALAGLAVAIAGTMGLWNIGAEGQILAGALGAAWVARIGETWSSPALITAMLVAGTIAGLVWALGPALAKAGLGVNEIITTLMLNEVAVRVVRYLLNGAWKDPASLNFPVAPKLPEAARLPGLFGRAHLGVVIALVVIALVAVVVNRSAWGYELRIAGSSGPAAAYAGISLKRKILTVLLVSGAIAGLGGAIELTGNAERITEGISNGYGFAGIIVAALALMRPWAIPAVAVVFGAVQVGGSSIQTLGVPASVADILQALILAGALIAGVLMAYRVRWVSTRAQDPSGDGLEAVAGV